MLADALGRCIDLLKEGLQLHVLEVGAGEEDDFSVALLVVQIVPELAFEVLEAHLEVLPSCLELNLEELLLDLAQSQYALVVWPASDAAL